jgi:hypothetical protein
MSENWSYQVRVYLSEDLAELARTDPDHPRLAPLSEVLRRHAATLACQLDAFAAYVAEAEQGGVDAYPLYKWTRATIDDPAKAAKHKLAFALRVGGREVYPKAAADLLEADLLPLVDGQGITRVSKQDNNPVNNIPVPVAYQ